MTDYPDPIEVSEPAEPALFAVPGTREEPDALHTASAPSKEPGRGKAAGLPPELRPRERLQEAGAEALSAAELLALVLDEANDEWSATASPLQTATDAISRLGGRAGLRDASYHELACALPHPDGSCASKIIAAIELGRRLMSIAGPDPHSITSPADVNRLVGGRMKDLDREHFVAVLLDNRNQVLDSPTISIGMLNFSPVHPREVFKPAIKASAAGVILAHNHPAGHLKPSEEDRQVTRRLSEAGKTIGIEVLDHVIVAREGYASLKEMDLM